MLEKREESVYLTDKEFMVLAACSGLTETEGFFRRPVSAELTDQEIYYICHDLMTRKILEMDKGPSEPYRTIMKTIGEAGDLLLLTLNEPARSVCCYLGDQVVWTEISPTEENSLRLRLLSRETFPKEFISGEFVPDGQLDALEPDPGAAQRIRKLLCVPQLQGESLLETDRLPSGVMMMAEQMRLPAGQVLCRIFLLEDSGRDYVAVDRNGSFGVFPFEREEMEKLIRSVLKESERI